MPRALVKFVLTVVSMFPAANVSTSGNTPVFDRRFSAKSFAILPTLSATESILTYLSSPISFHRSLTRSLISFSIAFCPSSTVSASPLLSSSSFSTMIMSARTSTSPSALMEASPMRAILLIFITLIATATPTPMSLCVAEALAFTSATVRFFAITRTAPFIFLSHGLLSSSSEPEDAETPALECALIAAPLSISARASLS